MKELVMKRLLVWKYCSVMLALALLCGIACADSSDAMLTLANDHGFEVETSTNDGGVLRCDYALANSKTARVTWSDAANQYTVKGDPNSVAQFYVDALSLGGWDSCKYIIGKKARISYGVKSNQVCDTLDEYLDQMQQTLGVTAAASAAATAESADVRDYILNTNSKKFRYPNCPSVAKMKDKNKQAFTGTREEVIAMGYDPCGQCNP